MSETNPNARLEAFCDGVFAIAMTLLIIEIRIPHTIEITDTATFWHALQHIAPSIAAFVLSFIIILITWVNHHATLKMVNRSSPTFNYANGLLLISVVFMPFPTALIGEHVLTDHASPAVILFAATIVLQTLGWISLCNAALHAGLAKSEKAIHQLRTNRNFGIYSFVIYSLLAVLAIWFPLTVALIIAVLWIFWLIYGIQIKHE